MRSSLVPRSCWTSVAEHDRRVIFVTRKKLRRYAESGAVHDAIVAAARHGEVIRARKERQKHELAVRIRGGASIESRGGGLHASAGYGIPRRRVEYRSAYHDVLLIHLPIERNGRDEELRYHHQNC